MAHRCWWHQSLCSSNIESESRFHKVCVP
jgi:hypothetical protein